MRALAAADVILHDDLVDRGRARACAAGARIVAVGKRGGCRSTPQAFIERLMVREARAGQSVVRLKGGDPFVFGRGGEELEALRARGHRGRGRARHHRGLAAPAALGIPVTHRALCARRRLVTGHAARTATEPDWAALARDAASRS